MRKQNSLTQRHRKEEATMQAALTSRGCSIIFHSTFRCRKVKGEKQRQNDSFSPHTQTKRANICKGEMAEWECGKG